MNDLCEREEKGCCLREEQHKRPSLYHDGENTTTPSRMSTNWKGLHWVIFSIGWVMSVLRRRRPTFIVSLAVCFLSLLVCCYLVVHPVGRPKYSEKRQSYEEENCTLSVCERQKTVREAFIFRGILHYSVIFLTKIIDCLLHCWVYFPTRRNRTHVLLRVGVFPSGPPSYSLFCPYSTAIL